MAHQHHPISLLALGEHLLLHIGEPEVVGVEVMAQRDDVHPLQLFSGQHGADHRLLFPPLLQGLRVSAR